ncbi:MAG: HNH endonuclease [Acidimicrobiia bacterium]|nr:HNH endonuclease [Acidimicrobiia bacterium]
MLKERNEVMGKPSAFWPNVGADLYGPWGPAPTDYGCDPMPRGIASLEPGPELAAMLESIRDHNLSDYHRFVVLDARQRMISYHTACLLDDIAAMVSRRMEAGRAHVSDSVVFDSAVAEVGYALHLTRRAAENKVALAMQTQHRIPEVRELLRRGEIDEPRAQVIVKSTMHLSDDVAKRVVSGVSEDAPELTTGQLRARIRNLCIEMEPDEAAHRYEEAVKARRLVTEQTDAGTAHLHCLDLSPERLAEATSRINSIAKSLRRDGESRTIDQLRADVLIDLLSGTHDYDTLGRGSRKGSVNIRVDLATLAELNDHPGDLAGYGPIIADIARKTAKRRTDVEFRFLVSDGNGDPVAVGTTRKRPRPSASRTTRKRTLTPKERRIVETLRPTCAFPGCRMPATDSDMDHIIDFVRGGPSEIPNSAPLCRYHNNVKTCGWTYEIVGRDRYRWTSPSGHTSTTKPDP